MDKNKRESLKALSMISQFGISMITPILLCVLLAKFLVNRYFPSQNWIIVFGVILGALSSFYSMIKLIGQINKKDE